MGGIRETEGGVPSAYAEDRAKLGLKADFKEAARWDGVRWRWMETCDAGSGVAAAALLYGNV